VSAEAKKSSENSWPSASRYSGRDIQFVAPRNNLHCKLGGTA